MSDYLQGLDKTLKGLMSSETMQKYGYPEDIRDLEGFPYTSHSEMIEHVKTGNAILIQGLHRSATVFSLMATRWERFLHSLGLFSPYVVAVCLVVYAVYSSTYWLLVGITFPLVSAYFTAPMFPIKKLIPWSAFGLAVLFLCLNLHDLAVLFAAYWVCHLGVVLSRDTYSYALLQRALALESAAIFLVHGWYVRLLDKDYRPFTRD